MKSITINALIIGAITLVFVMLGIFVNLYIILGILPCYLLWYVVYSNYNKKIHKPMETRKVTGLGILGALSIVLTLIPFLRFPLIPAAPFLEYDAADIPIMIGTFIYGPAAGLILTIVVSVIQGTTVSSQSGIIGIIMHIISTGTFAVVGGSIYKCNKSMLGAAFAILMGGLSACAIMIPANLLFMPLFIPTLTIEGVLKMITPIILPFNLLKYGINGALCFLLYKRIKKPIEFITNSINRNNKTIVIKNEAIEKAN